LRYVNEYIHIANIIIFFY